MNNDLKEFANILFAPSERDEYKRRINKAIEYIEQEKTRLAKEVSNTYIDTLDKTRLVNEDIYNELDEVLDILKGKNNND